MLGHALCIKAIHGGKAKTDKINPHKIEVLLPGGMLPRAYVCPKVMRETRDLLRRRPLSSAVAPRLLSTSVTPPASTTSRPSLRHYLQAAELKAASLDWTEVLAIEPDNPRVRLAAELLASSLHSSSNARARAFVAQGDGCRATFFNYRRRLAAGSVKDRT
jgi:hypothetical protein